MLAQINSFGITDIGLVRKNNEDAWQASPDASFYVLADGMGGHQAGEVAARYAVDTLCDIIDDTLAANLQKQPLVSAKKAVLSAIKETNRAVFELSLSDDGLYGMGTTLCCLFFHREGLIHGHVGDSRVYCYRKKKLVQLTVDHSLVRELVDRGQIPEMEADEFVYKNIITKAVGTDPEVEPTVDVCEYKKGDVFLMCSDGLSDYLSEHEMQEAMSHNNSLEHMAEQLIESAKNKGGHDNITVVLMKVEKDEKENLS